MNLRLGALLVTLSVPLWCSTLKAEPIRVRLPEGNTRGFLVLRSLDGPAIAYGELRQKPTGGVVESVLALSFKDGSRFEETTTFSQKGVFRLEAYHLVQRGPSFPKTEVSFDRKSRRYRAVTQEKKGDEGGGLTRLVAARGRSARCEGRSGPSVAARPA